jgi:hypothetical protein
MTIPKNITREHIIKAVAYIERTGVPPERQSREWFLRVNGEYYPPKYVLSVANRFANGVELDPKEFRISGARRYLTGLGFNVVTGYGATHTM